MKRKLLSMALCVCPLTLLLPVSVMACLPPAVTADGTAAYATASAMMIRTLFLWIS